MGDTEVADAFLCETNTGVTFYPPDPDDPCSHPTIAVADARASIGIERAAGGGLRFRITFDFEDVYAFADENGGQFLDPNGSVHYVIATDGPSSAVRDDA